MGAGVSGQAIVNAVTRVADSVVAKFGADEWSFFVSDNADLPLHDARSGLARLTRAAAEAIEATKAGFLLPGGTAHRAPLAGNARPDPHRGKLGRVLAEPSAARRCCGWPIAFGIVEALNMLSVGLRCRQREQPLLLGMPGLVPPLAIWATMVLDDRGNVGWEVKCVTSEALASLITGDDFGVLGESDDPGEQLSERQNRWPYAPGCRRQGVIIEQPVEVVESFALAHD